MDDRKKRPGTVQSAEDRDNAEIARRRGERLANIDAESAHQAQGFAIEDLSTPIIVESHDEDTPVEMRAPTRRSRPRRTVQEFASDIKADLRELRASIEELRRAGFNVRSEMLDRVVKLETHLELAKDLDTNVDELFKLRDDLTALRVTLLGADGTNGKIGNLGKAIKSVDEKADRGPRFLKRAVVIALGGIVGSLVPTALFVKDVVETAAAHRATFRAELDAAKADRAVLQGQVLVLFRIVGRRASDDSSPFDSFSPSVPSPGATP